MMSLALQEETQGMAWSPDPYLMLKLVVIRSHDIKALKTFYEIIGLKFQPEKHGDHSCLGKAKAEQLEVEKHYD